MFGATQDFQPVVDAIVAAGLKPPYRWDEYASHFLAPADRLVDRASRAADRDEASELFLRASALYRIARFPAPRSPLQAVAWERGKQAALAGLERQPRRMTQVTIPHTTHAGAGDGAALLGYYHLPPPPADPTHDGDAQPDVAKKVPLVVVFAGLDGYRTELAVWKEGWARLGVALLVVEIPGTGDNPADPADPAAPDRVWSSLFDWVARQDRIDQRRVVNWGFSTGGYYSIRLAHTHAERLRGVVALGGGCHHMFDPAWLEAADTMEYPFDLAHTLCHKFGYGDDFDRFKKEARARFSLLDTGILDRPGCARLLLVNGTEDEIFPIDDYYLCLQHGDPKEARFVRGTKHMGEPESFAIILEWLFKLLEVPGNVGEFLSTIPFKPKYLAE
ncbi:putative conidial pigment biosynthesis protein ayg1 protein [Rosellinia necatrix]|uniref:Putative conidial pigment biosynthesis protein ayg1 protein n=1 Tax=Rosellinia necatrix TaxID=77044 RepID=A0A1S7UI87_ROSNE|nr:putative conidial pigment biosynthesis protein ayg1 protein [Rosellinia necatrix]